MSEPVGGYARVACWIRSEGEVRRFPDEMALERFVMACPHTETVTVASGHQFCTRCWAMPRRHRKPKDILGFDPLNIKSLLEQMAEKILDNTEQWLRDPPPGEPMP